MPGAHWPSNLAKTESFHSVGDLVSKTKGGNIWGGYRITPSGLYTSLSACTRQCMQPLHTSAQQSGVTLLPPERPHRRTPTKQSVFLSFSCHVNQNVDLFSTQRWQWFSQCLLLRWPAARKILSEVKRMLTGQVSKALGRQGCPSLMNPSQASAVIRS